MNKSRFLRNFEQEIQSNFLLLEGFIWWGSFLHRDLLTNLFCQFYFYSQNKEFEKNWKWNIPKSLLKRRKILVSRFLTKKIEMDLEWNFAEGKVNGVDLQTQSWKISLWRIHQLKLWSRYISLNNLWIDENWRIWTISLIFSSSKISEKNPIYSLKGKENSNKKKIRLQLTKNDCFIEW